MCRTASSHRRATLILTLTQTATPSLTLTLTLTLTLCLVLQARYTRAKYEPAELVGCPRTVRYQAKLTPATACITGTTQAAASRVLLSSQ